MHPKVHEIWSPLLALEKFFKNVSKSNENRYIGVFWVADHEYHVPEDVGCTWGASHPYSDVIYEKHANFV